MKRTDIPALFPEATKEQIDQICKRQTKAKARKQRGFPELSGFR